MTHTVFEERDDNLGVIRLEKWEEPPRFVLWVGGVIVWKSDRANMSTLVAGQGCVCPPGANMVCQSTFCPRGRDGSPMTPKEHAEIWRKAAKVVRAMDTRSLYYRHDFVGSYTPSSAERQADISGPIYASAARVLDEIAVAYEEAKAG